jgi:hypothetical protein
MRVVKGSLMGILKIGVLDAYFICAGSTIMFKMFGHEDEMLWNMSG